MTVLLAVPTSEGSTAVARGMVGRGLLSWAKARSSGRSAKIERLQKRKRRFSGMASILETVSTVERNPVLLVIAQRLVGLLLGILVAEAERDVRGQLIAQGRRAAIALNVFGEEAA